MSQTTSLFQATDSLLRSRHAVGLTDWLANAVKQRQERSARGYADYRAVATDLSQAAGVPVSHETVRRWWQEIDKSSTPASGSGEGPGAGKEN